MKHRNKFFTILFIVLLGLSNSAIADKADGAKDGDKDRVRQQGVDEQGGSTQAEAPVIVVTGNWKKGRIYYRMVCSECHAREAGGKISPSEKTKAEWIDYFDKNIHGPQDVEAKYAASYFVSREFRESIKDTNRAAAKFLKVPADKLLEDVKAFLVHSAKDSDQPTSCE